MESTELIDIKPDDRFSIEIICEPASKIGSFTLQVETKWVRVKDGVCEAGFSITASPVGGQFQRYVDYLSFRSRNK